MIAYLNLVLLAPTEEILDIKSLIYLSLQHAPYDMTVVDAAFSMLPLTLLCPRVPLTLF